MRPKIKKVEFGNIQVNDEVYSDHDLFLFYDGVEPTEKSHRVSKKDFEHMMLKEPEIIIISLGFNNAVKIDNDVFVLAKKSNIELYALPTPDAIKKFEELVKKGKKVVARIHITC
ncbi:MAG: MTH938/NDUFAF3 family protein [Candidatus Aenigmatarchaeota archaeon]